MNAIKICPAQLLDLRNLEQIEAAVYPPHLAESPEVLGSRIKIAPHFCGVAKLDHHCVGYVLAHPWLDNSSPGLGKILDSIPQNADVIHLHDMAVLPEMRGKGAARLMLTWLESRLLVEGFSAITLVAVDGADKFWRVMGFDDLGPASGYDDVARLMRRHVPK